MKYGSSAYPESAGSYEFGIHSLSRKREQEFRAECLCHPARQLKDWRAST